MSGSPYGPKGNHNPAARYCVIIDDLTPIDDTVDCAECQRMHDLICLDPDFAEEFKDYSRPQARNFRRTA